MAQTIEQLIEFIATTETPKSVTNPIVAEALSLLLGKTYRLFDGEKVNNIVQEGGFSDVFVVNGQTVDPKAGDLLYSAEGTYDKWGIITDVHLEGKQLYVTYVWDGKVNTIMIDENGDAARYVNRYKTPKVYDIQSVLSASSAGNMQDYFLIKDPDNPTQSYFEFWQVGDLIGSPKGGIIVSDILNPGGLDNTMMYIYGGEIVTITYKAQSPAKILSVSKAKIGSPEDAANFNGSLYSRINAINSQFIVLDLPYAASLSEELLKIPAAIRRKGMRLKYKQVPYNKYIEGVYIDEDVSDDKWKGSGWVFNHVCGNVGGEPSIGICTRSASANDKESISVGYGAISYEQNSASFGNNVTARGQNSFAQGYGSFGTYFGDSVTFPTNDSIDFGDFDLQDLKVGDFVQMGIDDIGRALPVVRKIKSISGNIVTFTEEIPKEIRDYGEVYIDINKGSIGSCSFTANDDTNALNLAETAFGRWNKSVGEEGSDTLWKGNSTCTLFSIGNGTSHSNRRNAFEVKQDGTIHIQKPGTSNTFNLQGTIGNSTDAAKENGSLYARIRYLMEKKNYKRYNRTLLDKLTPQSSHEEITAAFTPIGESNFRRPQEGDVFIEGETGTWLGSSHDYIVTFCSAFWADWSMVCVSREKELAFNVVTSGDVRKLNLCRTRELGWPVDLVKNRGTDYVRAVNDVLLRKLYEACDAVYNADDDTYTLNEVKLTKDEMFDIYVNENMWNVRENIVSWGAYPYKPKTNIPPYRSLSSGVVGCRCVFVAYNNDSLETFKLCKKAADTNEEGWLISNFSFSFQGCKNLRKIIGVIQFSSAVKLSKDKLITMPALEVARFKFAQDAWIKDSPKLSYDSVKFMAEKSTNGSKAITISLHADVFAKLSGTASDDAYTQSGHTKEEWMALVTTAQGRNVSFAEAV